MEILSTGEKIKRARIYKGLTLKELCREKISVSKMSCIENGKVAPETWILEFVAKQLELPSDYLKQGVKEQILTNLKKVENEKDSSLYEESLEYNLKYAEEYGYADLTFNLVHKLFNHYISTNEMEKIQLIISKYYELWTQCSTPENEVLYYMDLAGYFYATEEYMQAAGYYKNVRAISKKNSDYNTLARATYNEAASYFMMQNFERAYEIAVRLSELVDYLELDLKKAEVYHLLGMLSLRRDEGKYLYYQEKAFELYGDNMEYKAYALYDFATVMLDISLEERAVLNIKKALSYYPNSDSPEKVDFMLKCVHCLIEHNLLEPAREECDEVLNLAIKIDNIKYIEKAYHYQSIVLRAEGNYLKAEMYMNLALDALLKFGTNNEIYKRYIEMGHMYHSMDNIPESLKYFNFAIQLQRKM